MNMKKFLSFTLFCIFFFSISAMDIPEMEKIMIENNPTIRQANETVRQAQLDLKDAKANFSPTISATVSATYMTEPIIGPVIMESSDILSQMGLGSYADSASGYVTLYDGMDNTMYMGSLSLTQPLITWGKLGKAVSLYENIYSAQALRKDDTVAQLQAELRVRVWSLKYLLEMKSLVEEALSLSSSLVDLAESGYENGMMLRQDYLEAKISAMEVEVKEAELLANLDSVKDGLASMLGLSEIDVEEIDFPQDESFLRSYENSSADELIAASTGEDSSNLKAIKNLLGAYSNQKTIALRSMYGIPDFALQAELTYSSSRFPFLETGWKQNDNSSLNLSIGFKTTLWDGGKVINDISRAESNIRSAEAQYDDALSEIRSAVKSNWNNMRSNLATIDYLEAKLENLEMELDTIRTEMEYGQKSEGDLKRKQLEIVNMKSQLLASKIALVQNVYTLQYLTGADFSD